MTYEEAQKLKARADYVLFAGWPYRIESVFNDTFISIFDEEPNSLHTDLIKIESCRLIDRSEALEIIANEKEEEKEKGYD